MSGSRGPPNLEKIVLSSKYFSEASCRIRAELGLTKYALAKLLFPKESPRGWSSYIFEVEAERHRASAKLAGAYIKRLGLPANETLKLIGNSFLKNYYSYLKLLKL